MKHTIHAAAAISAFARCLGAAQAQEVLTADDLVENPELLAQYGADLLGDVFHLLTAAGVAIGEVCGWGLDRYVEEAEPASDGRSDPAIAPRMLADLVASPYLKFVHDDPGGLLRQALALVEQPTVYLVESETEDVEGRTVEQRTTDPARANTVFYDTARRLGAARVDNLGDGELAAVDDGPRWTARVLLRVLRPDGM